MCYDWLAPVITIELQTEAREIKAAGLKLSNITELERKMLGKQFYIGQL